MYNYPSVFFNKLQCMCTCFGGELLDSLRALSRSSDTSAEYYKASMFTVHYKMHGVETVHRMTLCHLNRRGVATCQFRL